MLIYSLLRRKLSLVPVEYESAEEVSPVDLVSQSSGEGDFHSAEEEEGVDDVTDSDSDAEHSGLSARFHPGASLQHTKIRPPSPG